MTIGLIKGAVANTGNRIGKVYHCLNGDHASVCRHADLDALMTPFMTNTWHKGKVVGVLTGTMYDTKPRSNEDLTCSNFCQERMCCLCDHECHWLIINDGGYTIHGTAKFYYFFCYKYHFLTPDILISLYICFLEFICFISWEVYFWHFSHELRSSAKYRVSITHQETKNILCFRI